jgi:hypothetical protein
MTRTMTNVRKMSMLLAIAATLVATPVLILTPQLAQAQQGKDIIGRGTGQLNCPSGSSAPGDETIDFYASKDKGSIFGAFTSGSNEGFGYKFGYITGGHIGAKQYTLTGYEDTDNICSSQIPTTFTISGQCGQGVTIQFRAANGEEGQFTGNVACAK